VEERATEETKGRKGESAFSSFVHLFVFVNKREGGGALWRGGGGPSKASGAARQRAQRECCGEGERLFLDIKLCIPPSAIRRLKQNLLSHGERQSKGWQAD